MLREKWFSEEVVSRMKCNIMTDTEYMYLVRVE